MSGIDDSTTRALHRRILDEPAMHAAYTLGRIAAHKEVRDAQIRIAELESLVAQQAHDPRYRAPVAGVSGAVLAAHMQSAIAAAESQLPSGVALALFVVGADGGLAYICNADRRAMAGAVREWLHHEARKS